MILCALAALARYGGGGPSSLVCPGFMVPQPHISQNLADTHPAYRSRDIFDPARGSAV